MNAGSAWSSRHHNNLNISKMSPNSTWLVTSRHESHDTFDMSNPCILAVSSLSNSTARHVERVVSKHEKPSGIWAIGNKFNK